MQHCDVFVWIQEINEAWNFVIKFLIIHSALMGMYTQTHTKMSSHIEH